MDPQILINAAESELRDKDPDAFSVFVLALFGGLSRSEMDRLSWEQVDLQNGNIAIRATRPPRQLNLAWRFLIVVDETRFYEPKTANRVGKVPLSEYAIETLRSYKSHQMDKIEGHHGFNPNAYFVLPGAMPSDDMPKIRANPTFKRLTKWLRIKGLTDQKPIHSLRKMASSNIFDQTGSMEVAANFGRHLPQVARDHYVAKNEPIPVNFR